MAHFLAIFHNDEAIDNWVLSLCVNALYLLGKSAGQANNPSTSVGLKVSFPVPCGG